MALYQNFDVIPEVLCKQEVKTRLSVYCKPIEGGKYPGA